MGTNKWGPTTVSTLHEFRVVSSGSGVGYFLGNPRKGSTQKLFCELGDIECGKRLDILPLRRIIDECLEWSHDTLTLLL